eukprot:5161883-Amphidinium_carterae.1
MEDLWGEILNEEYQTFSGDLDCFHGVVHQPLQFTFFAQNSDQLSALDAKNVICTTQANCTTSVSAVERPGMYPLEHYLLIVLLHLISLEPRKHVIRHNLMCRPATKGFAPSITEHTHAC